MLRRERARIAYVHNAALPSAPTRHRNTTSNMVRNTETAHATIQNIIIDSNTTRYNNQRLHSPANDPHNPAMTHGDTINTDTLSQHNQQDTATTIKMVRYTDTAHATTARPIIDNGTTRQQAHQSTLHFYFTT